MKPCTASVWTLSLRRSASRRRVDVQTDGLPPDRWVEGAAWPGIVRYICTGSSVRTVPTICLSFVVAMMISSAGMAYAAESKDPPAKIRDPRSESKAYFAHFKEQSPIHYYLSLQRYDEAIAMFPSVEDIDAIDPMTGKTLLTAAASGSASDAYDAVRYLILQYGADISKPDESGLTALHFATASGNLPVVELLLKYGADIHAAPPGDQSCTVNCDKSDRTALYMAYLNGRTRIRDFLVSMGARQLDSDLIQELKYSARRLKISEGHRSAVPRNLDKEELEDWYRKKYTALFNDLAEFLRSEGQFDAASRLPSELEPLVQALLHTPRPPDMTSKEWNRLVKENMVKNLIRSKSKGEKNEL